MANKKISALTAATVVNDTDIIPIVQAGVNKKATRLLVKGAAATPTLDAVLAAGATLTLDRTIELAGKLLKVAQAGQVILSIDFLNNAIFLINNPAQVPQSAIIDLTGGQLVLTAHDNDGGTVIIDMDGLNNNIRYQAGTHIFEGIEEFADNASALAGGVLSGGLYFTDVSGERIVKTAFENV